MDDIPYWPKFMSNCWLELDALNRNLSQHCSEGWSFTWIEKRRKLKCAWHGEDSKVTRVNHKDEGLLAWPFKIVWEVGQNIKYAGQAFLSDPLSAGVEPLPGSLCSQYTYVSCDKGWLAHLPPPLGCKHYEKVCFLNLYFRFHFVYIYTKYI